MKDLSIIIKEVLDEVHAKHQRRLIQVAILSFFAGSFIAAGLLSHFNIS